MNKKIIYIVAAIVVILLIGAIAAVLLKSKKQTATSPQDNFNPLSYNMYTVAVDMRNGEYTATINAGEISKIVDEPMLSQYA